MLTFRWLHLTDLHLGAPKHKALWTDNVLTGFMEDLSGLRTTLRGPLDLLCFTGDLVFSGAAHEFTALQEWLERLYEKLAQRGLGRPAFLAVPGNHDLTRPADAAAARALIDGLPVDQPLTIPPLVSDAFANYAAFWQALKLPRPALHHGLLPGDFATTIPCGGYQIGVIGLNSTALQLTGDEDLAGKLLLSEDQLSAVCDGDVGAWLAQRHLTLLLSHHPPAWLRERERFESELAPPGRFFLHLCGHLHEPESHESSRGDGPAQRRWLGRSFFGLDRIRGEVQRSHGYRVGELRFEGQEARLRSLPRWAQRREDGTFGFLPDSRFYFQHGAPYTPERTLALALPPPPLARPQAAGLHYDPDWYVPRGPEESARELLHQGKSLLVLGPAHFGKSHFIEAVTRPLVAEQAFWRLTVDCTTLALEPAALFRDFANALTEDDEARQDQVGRRWQSQGLTEKVRLRNFLVQDLLRPAPGPVLLVLENADAVLTNEAFQGLFELLRSLVDNYQQLRLLVAAATSRIAFSFDTSALRDRLELIELKDLDRPQLEGLASRYGSFQAADLDALVAHAAGHPYLLRSYLYEAARRRAALQAVIADASFTEKLTGQMQSWLRDVPRNHQAAVARFADGEREPMAPELHNWLRRARFLSDDEKELRCALYRRLFQRIGGR